MYAQTKSDAALDIASIEAQAHALRSASIAKFGNNAGRWIGRTIRNFAVSFVEARRMEAMYRELNALSDRELRDMGIGRTDIPSVIAGTFKRDEYVAAETKTAAPQKIERQAPMHDDMKIAA